MRTLRWALVGAVAVLVSCGGGSSSVVYKVGDEGPGGGIIVYVDEAGFSNSSGDDTSIGAVCPKGTCHYLEMAPTNIGDWHSWDEAIMAARSFSTPSANDWVLPSKDALNVLFEFSNSSFGGFAPFPNSDYWSSSESDANSAWNQSISSGSQSTANKPYASYVRPVRAF